MSAELLNRLVAERDLVLAPTYAGDLHDPFLLKGMAPAVERILGALEKKEKIVVFADYDADGVPGAVILTEFFRRVGYANFEVYIPDRQTEAHGLSLKFIDGAAQGGASLIITIDCGSSNVAEAARARELGVDLIITDHHLLALSEVERPSAFVLINPKQPGDEYPEKMLCGAGVAFKLVQALSRRSLRETNLAWEKSLLDLVAIATISDRVPLLGENRALAKFGLLMLQRTRRPGLLALMAAAKLQPAVVNEDDVGFTIGPRINAAGRMTHAHEAYQLLTAANYSQAAPLALKLEKQNGERKLLVEEILKTAQAGLAEGEPPPVVVLGNEGWPPAVLGLAASRLAERWGRPVFLYGRNEAGDWKGSCRAGGAINLVELMRAANAGLPAPAGAPPLFTDLGGHAAAGGFSLVLGMEKELALRLLVAFQTLPALAPAVELVADLELGIEDVTSSLWQVLEQLAPFGAGNPKPLFSFSNLEIASSKTFGNGGIHLELGFRQTAGQVIKAVGFFDIYPHLDLSVGARLQLKATVEKSYFRGRGELRLRIVDLQ